VCLPEGQKVNPLTAGPLLEQYAGLSRIDARRRAARNMGLLAEGLGLDRARDLVAALRELGVEAFALSAARVPGEMVEVPIERIDGAEDDALHIQMNARGEIRAVAWSQVVAGLCTRKRFPEREQVAVTVDRPVRRAAGLGIRWTTMESETRYMTQPVRPRPQVTLVLSGRPGQAHIVTFGEDDVRYAYLGARILPTQHRNLCLLLRDIAAHCPHGFFPQGYRAASGGAFDRVPAVVGTLEYGRYVQWAVCCAAASNLFHTDGA